MILSIFLLNKYVIIKKNNKGMMNFMYPLVLLPETKDYIWGGKKLKEEFGIKTDKEIAAEAWMLSCHKDGINIVLNGEMAGKTLNEVLEVWGNDALGENAEKFEFFPIIIKLIDAQNKLSIQVHPDNDYAMRVEKEYGKTEMWYVVDCEKDARLIYGFNQNLTKKQFKESIENNTLTDFCNYVPVNKGDVFFIESGTLHAIGEGILIAEVQQNSDTTYRVFDYNRLGSDGKPRQLHVEKALDVTTLKKSKKPAFIKEKRVFMDATITKLESCELFTVEKIDLNGKTTVFCKESFVSLVCLNGSYDLLWENQNIKLEKGSSVFVPAGLEISLFGNAEFLYSRV